MILQHLPNSNTWSRLHHLLCTKTPSHTIPNRAIRYCQDPGVRFDGWIWSKLDFTAVSVTFYHDDIWRYQTSWLISKLECDHQFSHNKPSSKMRMRISNSPAISKPHYAEKTDNRARMSDRRVSTIVQQYCGFFFFQASLSRKDIKQEWMAVVGFQQLLTVVQQYCGLFFFLLSSLNSTIVQQYCGFFCFLVWSLNSTFVQQVSGIFFFLVPSLNSTIVQPYCGLFIFPVSPVKCNAIRLRSSKQKCHAILPRGLAGESRIHVLRRKEKIIRTCLCMYTHCE